jgi:branched-chain amino acid transport system substrate-binding protein
VPYKIGVVADLSGGNTAIGVPTRDTVVLYADRVNAGGGITGPDGKQHSIEVIVVDAKSDETGAAQAVKQLIGQQVVGIIGPTSSGATLATVPIVNAAQVPMLAVAASTAVVEPIAERPFVFQTAQNDRTSAAVLVREFAARNFTNVAYLYANNAYGHNGLAEFERAAESGGIRLVYTGAYAPDATDMTSQLTAALATTPDVIVNWAVVPPSATVSKNRVTLGSSTPLYQSAGAGNRYFLEAAGTAAEGVRLAAGKILVANELPDSDPQKMVLVQFITDYQARYNSEPGTFAGNAHDAFFLLLEALKRVGPDPIKIRAELEHMQEFVGVTGIFNYAEDNHNGLDERTLALIEIKDGKWTLAQ